MLFLPIGSSLSPISEVVGVDSSPSTSSLLSDSGGGVGSSSEENIDSFDVHPVNRWVVEDSGSDFDVIEIDNGLLNVSDKGDGTDDRYTISRDLRDLDGDVQLRFKVDSNSSSTHAKDALNIQLSADGGYVTGSRIFMSITSIDNDRYCGTKLYYYGDTEATKILAGDEQIYVNVWYRLRIDYDILKSEFRWRCYFDNGSKVFDYDWYDINEDYRPVFFEQQTVDLSLFCRSYTVNNTKTYQFDYVEAPFKEREWVTEEESSDPQWVEKAWNLAYVEDEVVTDVCNYSLVVPRFDSVSGILSFTSDTSNYASIHGGYQYFGIYGVDADDGDRHEIVTVFNAVYDDGSGDDIRQGISTGEAWVVNEYSHITAYTGAEQPMIEFEIGTYEDRSVVVCKIRAYPDGADTTVYDDYVINIDGLSYSQEFVLESYYWVNINGGDDLTMSNVELSLLERDWLGDIQGFVGGVIGAGQDLVGGGVDIFTSLFRWLGSMLGAAFSFVGEILRVAIEGVTSAVVTLQTAITGAIANIQGWLTTLGSAITGAIADIQGWLNTIGSAITDAVAAIITSFVDGAADFIEAIFDGMLVIVSTIVNIIASTMFFLWDAVGFPDILAIIDLFLAAFVEAVTNFPTFVDEVVPAIQATVKLGAIIGIFVFLIFPTLSAESVGEFIEKFLDYFFKDATMGMAIFGYTVPIPIGLLWLLTIIIIIESTIFGGFF